jgi:hypothetical protein
MIEIEFEEPENTKCECCDDTSIWLSRFVSDDGEPLAVYNTVFTEGHPERGMVGIISLGDWGGWDEDDQGSIPDSRVAFAFDLRLNDENVFNLMVIDAVETHWSNNDILGKMLSREEALAHPWIKEAFHISDHMTVEDPVIRDFFAGETIH